MKTLETLNAHSLRALLRAWQATQFHRSALYFVIALIVAALAFASLI